MFEVHLQGETLASSPVLPSIPTDDDLHVTLSANGTHKILASLWTSIFSHARLRRLSLVDLQLYQSDARMLADLLRDNTDLLEFKLQSVRQSVYVFDSILNEGLQANRGIRTLTLSDLEHIDTATVASLIQHNRTIQHLALTHDNVTSNGAALIADALRTNSTLISLDLSHNRIDDEGAASLMDIVRQSHPSLVQLNLSGNTIKADTRSSTTTRVILVDEMQPMLPADESTDEVQPSPTKSKYRYLSTILVTFLFFLWGMPNQLNDVLIRQFSKAFVLSRFEAGLVQSAFYIGYFAWSLPAAYVLRRWGYKTGLVLGLGLFGTGSFLFWPAALIGQYVPFLIALFIIASGLAFLETAANPFIANAAGPASASEKRLNIAQAFNPLGAITGALIGTLFIFSGIELNAQQVEQMRANRTYDEYLRKETLRVVQPYVILGGVAYLWAVLIALTPFPANTVKASETTDVQKSDSLCRPLFLFSLLAQFAYVGSQVGAWSYFMQYADDYVTFAEKAAGYLLTGTLVMFAIGRLTGALLMHCGFSPSILLATFALINVLLTVITVLVPNSIGLGALFLTSFFMSLMFPTIFALGIKGLNAQTTKLASCLLVMAIVGGAVFPPLMGLISVKTKQLALAYALPGGGYLIIALYALLSYVLTAERRTSA